MRTREVMRRIPFTFYGNRWHVLEIGFPDGQRRYELTTNGDAGRFTYVADMTKADIDRWLSDWSKGDRAKLLLTAQNAVASSGDSGGGGLVESRASTRQVVKDCCVEVKRLRRKLRAMKRS